MEKDSIENILLLLDGGMFDYLDIETKFDFVCWLYDSIQIIKCDFDVYTSLKKCEIAKWYFVNESKDGMPIKYFVSSHYEWASNVKIKISFFTSSVSNDVEAVFKLYFNSKLLDITHKIHIGTASLWQKNVLKKLNDFLWKFVF